MDLREMLIKELKWINGLYLSYRDTLENEHDFAEALLDMNPSEEVQNACEDFLDNYTDTKGILFSDLSESSNMGSMLIDKIMRGENVSASSLGIISRIQPKYKLTVSSYMEGPEGESSTESGKVPKKSVSQKSKSYDEIPIRTRLDASIYIKFLVSDEFQEVHQKAVKILFPSYTMNEIAGIITRIWDHLDCSFKGKTIQALVNEVTNMLKQLKQLKTGADESTETDIFDNFDDCCCICLELYETAPVKVLRCDHKFHDHCLRGWRENQSSCPMCRKFILLK